MVVLLLPQPVEAGDAFPCPLLMPSPPGVFLWALSNFPIRCRRFPLCRIVAGSALGSTCSGSNSFHVWPLSQWQAPSALLLAKTVGVSSIRKVPSLHLMALLPAHNHT